MPVLFRSPIGAFHVASETMVHELPPNGGVPQLLDPIGFRQWNEPVASPFQAIERSREEQLAIMLEAFPRLLERCGIEGGFDRADLGGLLLRNDVPARDQGAIRAALDAFDEIAGPDGILSPQDVQRALAPAAAPSAPTRPPYDPGHDAADLYRAMHSGLFGWGADADAIFRVLDGKTPEEIAALRCAYLDHYQRDLDEDLASELSGDQLERAENLLRADRVTAAAAQIRYAMHGGIGWGTDEAGIYSGLENLNIQDRQRLESVYREQYGVDLRDDLGSELGGEELSRAIALLEGDGNSAAAAAIHHAMHGGTGWGCDEASINRALEGRTPEELAELQRLYRERYDAELSDHFRDEMSGPELDRALALLEGSPLAANAAAIRHAMGSWSTDLDSIREILDGASREERDQIAGEFRALYGEELTDAIARDTSGNQREQILGWLERGALSDAERLHYAIDGWGTDEQAIREVLTNRTAAEIDLIRADYSNRYDRDLDEDIANDVSGRDLFDIQMMLRGRAQNVEEALARAREALEFERSGSANWASSRLFALGDTLGVTENHGSILDQNLQRAEAYHRQAIADGQLDDAERARLEALVGYVNEDVTSYREQRDSASELAATVAGITAAVAVSFGTAGTGTPFAVTVLLGACAGATARVGARFLIQGNAYGLEQIGTDAAIGGAEGAFVIASAGAGRAVARSLLLRSAESCLARASITVSLEGVRDAGAARLLGLTARELLETSVARSITFSGIEGGVNGAVVGAFVGGNRVAFHDGTWDDGLTRGATQVALGAGHGAATGAVIGAGIGAGIGAFRAPNLIDDRMVEVHVRGSDGTSWIQHGTFEDMQLVTTAVHPTPHVLQFGTRNVEVWGLRNVQELTNIRSALERLHSVQAVEAIPERIFLRTDLGGGIRGLGGAENTIIAQRGAITTPLLGQRIIWHEAGHNLDAARGWVSGTGQTPFGTGSVRVSPIASMNACEDFAETHAFLIEHWESIVANPHTSQRLPPEVMARLRWLFENVYQR